MSRGSMHGGGFFFQSFGSMSCRQGTCVSSGVPGTPGAWQLLHPALTFTCRWMVVRFSLPLAVNGSYFFQFGVGQAGAETVYAPSDGTSIVLTLSAAPPNDWENMFSFPLMISVGTRVTGRIADWTGVGVGSLFTRVMFLG